MKVFVLLLLAVASNTAFSHGMSAEDQARILNAGYLEYIRLGATHMLSGYDHLLFLFGVIFFLSRFVEVVKFITAFTVGHSITLVFATLLGIKANYYLIDAVIALTVCYKAFDNLEGFKKYLSMRSPNLMWMVFAFGLIHGFGLSTRLQQLPLGEDGLVMKILAFNVGVELGQIIALSFMLIILAGWRKTASFVRFSKAANIVLLSLGGLLLFMQLHGYQHTQFSDDFPLNQDDHSHTHEEMDKMKSSPLRYENKFKTQSNINRQSEGSVPKQPTLEDHEEEALPETHSHDNEHYHSH